MAPSKSVAIVGATGTIGRHIVKNLLERKIFKVTALTRDALPTGLSDDVTVKVIDYKNPSTIVTALQGQDFLVITMANTAPAEPQLALVKAAAEAGVKFVLPNEWGSDTASPYNINAGIYKQKQAVRDYIEKLGVSSWIAVVGNQWYEMSLSTGRYGINIANRTATLCDDGTVPTTTTTWLQEGRAVANLLSLPTEAEHGSLSVSNFANKYVYISSFLLTQQEMLQSVQRITKTSDKDWTIQRINLKDELTRLQVGWRGGDHEALLQWVSLSNFLPGSGNDFAKDASKTANKELGLEVEDLDDATSRAIAESNRRARPHN